MNSKSSLKQISDFIHNAHQLDLDFQVLRYTYLIKALQQFQSPDIDQLWLSNLLKHLENNDIKDITFLTTINLSNLDALWLRNNKISNLDSMKNVSFTKLRYLYLNNNKINSLSNGFKDTPFSSLIDFDLANNQFINLDSFVECNFSCLEKLDIAENKLTSIKILSQISFPSLKQFKLSCNFIHDFQPLCKTQLSNLQILYIDSNYITQFDFTTKIKLPALTLLCVRKNNYSTLAYLLKFENYKYNDVLLDEQFYDINHPLVHALNKNQLYT